MSTSIIPMARCVERINAVAVFGPRRNCKMTISAVAATSAGASVCSAKKGDYYKMLSLEHSTAVGAEEIKRAYRRLALRYHPDVCPPLRRVESTELFLELRRAYETLSDPAQRVQYDAELRTGEKATAADGFARVVWEAQLCVLRAQSERRRPPVLTARTYDSLGP